VVSLAEKATLRNATRIQAALQTRGAATTSSYLSKPNNSTARSLKQSGVVDANGDGSQTIHDGSSHFQIYDRLVRTAETLNSPINSVGESSPEQHDRISNKANDFLVKCAIIAPSIASPVCVDPRLWSEEVSANIEWFRANQARLPASPFTLNETTCVFDEVYTAQSELHIKNPKNFYDVLKADISIGPKGYITFVGVLPNRLKLLRNYVERNRS
jgi:hypothetical protein